MQTEIRRQDCVSPHLRRDERDRRSAARVAVAHFAVAAFIALIILIDPNGSHFTLLAGLLLGLCAGFLLTQSRDHRIDLLNPAVVFAIVWAVMFGIRPLLMHSTGDYALRGTYSFPAHLDQAMLLALLGGASFVAGYSFCNVHRQSRRVRSGALGRAVAEREVSRPVVAVGITCVGTAAAYLGFQPVLGGTSAYVYYLPLMLVPVSVAAFADWLAHRRFVSLLLFLIPGSIYMLRYALTGQRAFVLFLLVGVVLAYYQHKNSSPRISTAAFAAVGVIIVIFYGFEVYRAGARGGEVEQSSSAGEALLRVFMGGTTEMLPAFSALLGTEGQIWQQANGRTLYTAAVHWIPSALWSDKPRTYDEVIYSIMFPDHYAVDKANTQFSILGDWYSDSGVTGVIIGMFLVGSGARWLYSKSQAPSARWRLVYALFPALFVTTLRGNIALNLGIALFLIGPIFLLYRRRRP